MDFVFDSGVLLMHGLLYAISEYMRCVWMSYI
jgi:hypothetical protein